ncbi:response regulator [Mesobaculum littorinae]|uniref:histidine kinase n=1 Tax=Mesobaculum littorinae TaxID=2486419 RepID=A0A438AHK7_9RHOB|nr:PAS-domain containing protein [Mesobaculum littorinae]RVV98154.1 response regulator [Mesobaculum littorinae]
MDLPEPPHEPSHETPHGPQPDPRADRLPDLAPDSLAGLQPELRHDLRPAPLSQSLSQSPSQPLSDERRRRLAAERLLERREAELRTANRRLAAQALDLADRAAAAERAAAAQDSCRQALAARDTARAQTEAIRDTLATTLHALHTLPEALAIFDRDARLVLANPAYIELFDELEAVQPGILYHEICSLLIDEGIAVPDGGREAWLAEAAACWEGDPAPDLTFRHFGGATLRIENRRMPDGGRVSRITDITEEMRMLAAIETIPDGFVLFDQEDRLVVCNRRYREIYPESAAAMIPGTPFEDILRFGLENGQYAAATGREEAWLDERLTAHRQADTMLEQHLSDGRWLRILEAETPDGGRVGLRVDITAIKAQQAALDEARQRAEAASRAKSTFLANMSHEIRTPMNGVVGMAELLGETGLDTEQRRFVDTIRSSGAALLEILNDILDYSKIEAGKLTLKRAAFDLESLIDETAALLRPRAREKGLDLRVDYDTGLPARYDGDAGRIRQVLINLVGNAVKFTPSGSVTIRVVGFAPDPAAETGTGTQSGARPGGGPERWRLHVAVTDTGIGIGKDKLGHIFGSFNQVDRTDTRQAEGTGLGLTISRDLVHLMGGEMWVESDPGQGSTFGFALPLDLVAQTGPAMAGPLGGYPARALVLDPDDRQRVHLLRLLDDMGIAPVAEAADLRPGDAAFLAQSLPPTRRDAALAACTACGAGPVFLLAPDAMTQGAEAPLPAGIAERLVQPPRRRTLERALHRAMDARAIPPAAVDRTDAALLAPLRVIAAEDNAINRMVLAGMLKSQNVALRFAENGAEALAAYLQERPDLVLMDISMPVMGGSEATRRIRNHEEAAALPPVPIIAVTAHAMPEDIEEFRRSGFDQALTKPLSRDQLLATLDATRQKRDGGGPL